MVALVFDECVELRRECVAEQIPPHFVGVRHDALDVYFSVYVDAYIALAELFAEYAL
jgi:hypothetical protein